jgi:UDP-N-acetylglucosamine--N-acetylmuramyl-(pentapeptide) pyrophosphoryl-undecaprenol N-acetylglucosamine transferase
MSKFFVTGGGTGGHIYPAIAVIDALSDAEVYYVGNPKNLEFEIAKQKGYNFLPVRINGMPRQFGFALIKWAFQLVRASFKAGYYLNKYKPDAVFATGGYVSAPVLIACNILGCPYMIHDCDAQPGLVSRYLAPGAANVSLAFESAKKFIKNKNAHVNGNPIRYEFKTLPQSRAREMLGLQERLTVCVMGGSQGARTINDAAVELLKELSTGHNIQVIFQTGKKNFERVIERLIHIYPEYTNDKNLIVRPYFDNMVAVLKASDIAVSRAGSVSLSEICASAIAPVLVPFPYAAADHQRKNANYLVAHGAALYIEDHDLTKHSLKKAVLSLVENPERLNEVKGNSLALAKFDGCERIVEQLKGITK